MGMRLEGVHFGNDSSDITLNAAAALDGTVTMLQICPERRVSLNAYTDSSGSDAYSQALSQQRADSVRIYLIEQGIAASRIEACGPGESEPVSDNGNPAGRAENRRVEIHPID